MNSQYQNYYNVIKKYNSKILKDGWNGLANGEEIFYISNSDLGL